MNTQKLEQIAKELVAPGKGILAADESIDTIGKRFEVVSVENTEENRKSYRQMLFATPGIEEFISGIILFDETLRQNILDNLPAQAGKNIIVGIKVDQGLEDFKSKEKVTKGLDGLAERLLEYVRLGAKFTKWRAVFNIDENNNLPTKECIVENAKRLAEYALVSQEAGLVPIVEPEVLLDGNHAIEKCQEVLENVLAELFLQLKIKNVALSGLILKVNMVLPADTKKVAQKTLQVLGECVPSEVAGIVFLSGGQPDVQATQNLNEIVKLAQKEGGAPWPITFSYGRALQDSPMRIWAGNLENKEAAQKEFLEKCRQNSLASQGRL